MGSIHHQLQFLRLFDGMRARRLPTRHEKREPALRVRVEVNKNRLINHNSDVVALKECEPLLQMRWTTDGNEH